MKNGKLRVGIIGCGGIANQKHFPALMTQSDRVDLVAFCDIIPERAQTAAAKYGIEGAKVCTDYMEIAQDASIDVVHVLTPNVSHSAISIACLENGKHVMCEKPMAATSADAKAMLEASKKSGKMLTIGYQNRYRSDVLLLKELIDDGELGDIYYAKAHALRRRGVPTWGVFTDKAAQGGGPLIDIGTHSLDITLWHMNNYAPKSVMGVTYNKLGTTLSGKQQGNTMGVWDPTTYEVEDAAFGFITMENGALISLESSWVLNITDERQGMNTLCGTKGGSTMERGETPADARLILNKIMAGKHVTITPKLDSPAIRRRPDRGMGLSAELECKAWYDAIEGKGELSTKPEQALVVTQILEAIYISAQTGKAVEF